MRAQKDEGDVLYVSNKAVRAHVLAFSHRLRQKAFFKFFSRRRIPIPLDLRIISATQHNSNENDERLVTKKMPYAFFCDTA